MPAPYNYPDILSASAGLLGRAVEVMGQIELPFVVIGGWSPYLLNKGQIRHPGTRDVDLLFEDGATPGALREVVKALIGAGFLLSAKHEFQLLQVLRVAGIEFVFNVDILHASEARKNPQMFVDHVSLPVRVSEFGPATVPARSIVVPVSRFLFSGHIVEHEFSFKSPETGADAKAAVPLMNELGTLVTKAESMSMTKRRRDAFDVMLAIQQVRDRGELLEGMRRLRTEHPEAFLELSKLHRLTKDKALRANISSYWNEAADDTTWAKVRSGVSSLLADAAVEPAIGDVGLKQGT